MPGLATLLVTFVSAALIRVPTFPAVGGRSNDAIPIGYLGTVSCAFFYAVRRWQPLSAPAKSATLRTALVWAAALAVMYCMAAALPVLAILIKGGRPYGAVLWTFPAYFVGGAGAALAYWALRSVSHRASGRYALGVLGGICVYGAVAPVVSMLSTTPIDASLSVLAALVAGGIVGPAIAMDQTVVQ